MDAMTRREALGAIAASAATAAGCTRTSEGQEHTMTGQREPLSEAGPAAAAPRAEGPDDPVSGQLQGLVPLAMPWQTRDPFLFCVHHDDAYPRGNEQLGPAASLAGRRMGMDFEGKDGWRMYHGEVVPGFPEHPHRGFETVTVVRNGLLDHSDSMGAAARYGQGDVQWLTAGAGIQHAEMFPLVNRDVPNPVELFQIWLNLPRARKMAKPYFSMLWAPTIPRISLKDAGGRKITVTTVAGALPGGEAAPPAPPPESWAASPEADVAIWTIHLEAGARWTIPPAREGTNRSLYAFRGDGLRIAGQPVPVGHRADVLAHVGATLQAGEEAQLLMLQGRPIGEPVVSHGPFVMNTQDEIRQAYADFQRTRFGGWPWSRRDPVHPATEGRFAKHPDGRVDRPA